jgi:hypothetical protein
MLALVEEIFRRTPDERMREAYGYAVAVSTECGNAREDSEKRGFGFIGTHISKSRCGTPATRRLRSYINEQQRLQTSARN